MRLTEISRPLLLLGAVQGQRIHHSAAPRAGLVAEPLPSGPRGPPPEDGLEAAGADHHGDGEDEDEADGGPRHVELVEVGVAERVDDAQVDVADGLHGAQLGLHESDAEVHKVVHDRDGIYQYRIDQWFWTLRYIQGGPSPGLVLPGLIGRTG